MLRLLALLAAAILPAMAALFYVQIGLRHERTERVREGVLRQAQMMAATVDTLVDGGRQVALTITRLSEAPDFAARCGVTVAALRESLPNYALIEVVGADGRPSCQSGAAGGSGLQVQAAAAIGAQRFVVGHYLPVSGGAAILPIVQPFTAGGQRQAVVLGIDIAWLNQHLRAFHTLPVSVIDVADANGTVLLRLQGSGTSVHVPAAGTTLPPLALALARESQPGTRTVQQRGGGQWMVGYVPGSDAGALFVSYAVGLQQILAAIDRKTSQGLVLIIGGGVLSLLLLVLITRTLVYAPTDALLSAAQRWASGDLEARARLRVAKRSEFGRLAEAFNSMAEALDARRSQLQQLNSSLEARVAERTHTLSETNNRLQVEITERERTDAALRRAQKLQAVGHLAGGVAHEFNNLLTTVLGALELIRLRLPQDHPVQRSVAAATSASQRGARLTSQLLAFARRRRLMPVVVDLNTVIAEMRELLEGTISRSMTLKLDLATDLWPALADRHEIEAAILNLTLNAREAMGLGGILRLATRNAVLPRPGSHAEPHGDFVEVIVEDDGIGMDEEELAQAIEPFFTTKRVGQGAGLGLSQVHGVAQQLGGDLHISSTKGQGTTVSLFLPRVLVTAAAPEPPVCQDYGAHRPLLLVDDDDQVRQIATEMLGALGYDVRSAASGAEALDLLRRQAGLQPFAALVADYAMPGMSGLELIAEAQRLQPGIVTLLITGYMDLDGAAHADLLEPRQVLRKPFTLSELAGRIAELTGTRAPETV